MLTKVNKAELLEIDNPDYEAIISRYSHLNGVEIHDKDAKTSLPVHVVLSGGEYARIKTETKPRVGKEGEPVAEYTKLGWFITSPGEEFDYEELCCLDVLGLADAPTHDQGTVYSEFKEQLTGSYETGLPWHGRVVRNWPAMARKLPKFAQQQAREFTMDEQPRKEATSRWSQRRVRHHHSRPTQGGDRRTSIKLW